LHWSDEGIYLELIADAIGYNVEMQLAEPAKHKRVIVGTPDTYGRVFAAYDGERFVQTCSETNNTAGGSPGDRRLFERAH